MREIEPEDIDIAESFMEITQNVWFQVVEEVEEFGNGREQENGPVFSTRDEAEEYVEDNDGLTEDDIRECNVNTGFRTIAVRVGDPLEQVASHLDHLENATDDDKEAICEALDSTYDLLEELEEALAGDLDRVTHPMLQHGERDRSWRCYTPYEERDD